MPVELETRRGHEHDVITVRGELDVAAAPALRDALAATTAPLVLVDLCPCEFVDSTGLSVLLNGLRRLTREGRRLELVCVPGLVQRALEITRLDETFRVHGSLTDATR